MVPRRDTSQVAGSSDKHTAKTGIATVRDMAVVNLKKRIAIMVRLIADCDRLATNLDQEVQAAEHRVKTRPKEIAHSTYAQAAAFRRDNLRRSADELRGELAKARKVLLEIDEGA
jgi:hypothetical protein